MKLYTSYWAQVRNFPKNLVGLNTTVWPPKWRPLGQDKNGIWVIDCPPLKPGSECDGLCNGKCNPKHPNDCNFLKIYHAQLDKIDFKIFIKHLNTLAKTIQLGENLEKVDFAFLVYEKYDNPCSERVVIQQWLKSNRMEFEEWEK